ncbi:uncharacterized protein si:dkey-29h14.10 [Thunnus thynnus]|uniref:uncharacterized protein si:dkey-29h14.10 n=1 Tax=Thunnus thynnus TaxID=8237 RepID=UPI0035297EEC
MMNTSDPLAPSPFINSNLTKMKERTSFNQVMSCRASSMYKVMQMVQKMAQKSCRRACQLFCCPLDNLLCENITWCPENHHPAQDKTIPVSLRNPPPSTILIVNISNSTLIDCVIGNDTYPSAVAENQPLMQESELQMHDHMRCSCSCGQQGAAQTSAVPPPPPPPPSAEPQSINIHSSNLSCVIIGDNNYMQVDKTRLMESEDTHM